MSNKIDELHLKLNNIVWIFDKNTFALDSFSYSSFSGYCYKFHTKYIDSKHMKCICVTGEDGTEGFKIDNIISDISEKLFIKIIAEAIFEKEWIYDNKIWAVVSVDIFHISDGLHIFFKNKDGEKITIKLDIFQNIEYINKKPLFLRKAKKTDLINFFKKTEKKDIMDLLSLKFYEKVSCNNLSKYLNNVGSETWKFDSIRPFNLKSRFSLCRPTINGYTVEFTNGPLKKIISIETDEPLKNKEKIKSLIQQKIQI